jgi:hypothetical protein
VCRILPAQAGKDKAELLGERDSDPRGAELFVAGEAVQSKADQGLEYALKSSVPSCL